MSGQPYFHFRLGGGGGIWGDFLISAFSFFFFLFSLCFLLSGLGIELFCGGFLFLLLFPLFSPFEFFLLWFFFFSGGNFSFLFSPLKNFFLDIFFWE